MSPDDLLMAELKSIVDKASNDLDEGAKSEAIEVLGMLSKAWDNDEEVNTSNHLFVLTVHDKSMVDLAKSDPRATVVDRDIPDDLAPDAVGGKVTHMAESSNLGDFVSGVCNEEAMLLIGYNTNPHGLLVRCNYDDGSKFSIMATPDHVATERKSASGSTVTKCYKTDDGRPDDLEAYSKPEQALLRGLWQGLVMPHAFRTKYPEAFEAMAKEVMAKWEKEIDDKQ